jgi:hypothetical protein
MARVEGNDAAAQDRVPVDDPSTPGYTLVRLPGSYRIRMSGAEGVA